MTLRALLTKRTTLRALFRKHGVKSLKVYVCASSWSRLGLDFTLKQSVDHFDSIDALRAGVRKLGFKKIRKHASGVEFAAGVSMAPPRDLELALAIVVNFERFFEFWAIHEPFKILNTPAELERARRRLTYAEIFCDGPSLVVDGLQGGAPSRTIEAALHGLFTKGTASELKKLLQLFTARAARSTSGTASRAG